MKNKSVNLSESQVWLVAKGLSVLTSPSGLDMLRREFPLMDRWEFDDDVADILDQLEIEEGEEGVCQ